MSRKTGSVKPCSKSKKSNKERRINLTKTSRGNKVRKNPRHYKKKILKKPRKRKISNLRLQMPKICQRGHKIL